MAHSSTLSATAATASLRLPASSPAFAKQCSIPRASSVSAAGGLNPVGMSAQKLNYSSSLGLRRGGVVIGDDAKRLLQGSRINAASTRPAGAGWTEAPKKKKTVEVFDREEDLAACLAKYIADLSAKYIKAKGSFNVVLSGGTLIQSLRKLVEQPYLESIEWSKWNIFWVDERVVPKDHVDSNYKLAFDALLSKVPILLSNVYAINDSLSAETAADEYEIRLKNFAYANDMDTAPATGLPKFDLILLGMGPEGHVASLFPGSPLFQEKQKLVAYIKDSPKPPPQRITFTLPLINSAANIAIVVCGAAQANAVQVALGKCQISEKVPVTMVAPQEELKWFLDKYAAF